MVAQMRVALIHSYVSVLYLHLVAVEVGLGSLVLLEEIYHWGQA